MMPMRLNAKLSVLGQGSAAKCLPCSMSRVHGHASTQSRNCPRFFKQRRPPCTTCWSCFGCGALSRRACEWRWPSCSGSWRRHRRCLRISRSLIWVNYEYRRRRSARLLASASALTVALYDSMFTAAWADTDQQTTWSPVSRTGSAVTLLSWPTCFTLPLHQAFQVPSAAVPPALPYMVECNSYANVAADRVAACPGTCILQTS